MVQNQSIVKIVDNSGVLQVKFIKVVGKPSRCYGEVGEVFVGVVMKVNKNKVGKVRFRKGSLIRALLVRCHKEGHLHNKFSGFYLKENISKPCGVLVKVSKGRLAFSETLGNRFFGAFSSKVACLVNTRGVFSIKSQFN